MSTSTLELEMVRLSVIIKLL